MSNIHNFTRHLSDDIDTHGPKKYSNELMIRKAADVCLTLTRRPLAARF
jgi:hypothetical protein